MIQNVKEDARNSFLERTFIFSGFTLFFLHIPFYIANFDIWWYFRVGQFILENHSVPRLDIYSYTAFGQPWINHHWISQIIYYLLYKSFGLHGLMVFKAAIITLTFYIVYRLSKIIFKNLYMAYLITLLAFLCGSIRFFLSAETISCFFLSAFFYIFVLFKHERKDRLWLLPVLMLIWINVHASAILGSAIIFIFALSEYLRYQTQRFRFQNHDFLLDAGRVKKLWGIALIVFLTTFINPYGYKLHLFLVQVQGPAPFAKLPLQGIIAENVRPSLMQGDYYSLFFFLSVAILILNLKNLDLTYTLFFAVGFLLSQLAVRHVEIFAIMSVTFFSHNFRKIADWSKTKFGFYAPRVSNFVRQRGIISLKLIAIFLILTPFFYHQCYRHLDNLRNIAVDNSRFPVRAVDFIKENGISGHMFNSYRFGGYLIWALYPQEKVFMDGRLVCYTENGVFDDYDAVYRIPVGDDGWEKIFDKYNVDYTILYYSLETSDHNLSMNLYQDKDWTLVYWDDLALVYVKNIPKFEKIIRRYAYNIINPVDPTFQGITQSQDFQRLIQELERKIQEDPKCFLAYDRLGIIYERQGDLVKAADYFKNAAELTPFNAISHFNLGLVQQKLGLMEEAKTQYRLAIKLKRNHYKSYLQLGILDFINNRYDSAIKYFQEAVKTYKKGTDIELAYLYLGACYQNAGRFSKAEKMYQKALEIAPTLQQAKDNLAQMRAKGLI